MSCLVETFLIDARLLPAADFALLMGWSPETERAQRARRNVPEFMRRGQAVFYRWDDIVEWLVERSVGQQAAVMDLLR